MEVKTPSAYIEKYFDTLSSNQWLSTKIHHLLIQQTEADVIKRNLLRELGMWQIPTEEESSQGDAAIGKSEKSRDKEIIALKLMAFDAASYCKNILVHIDKLDPYRVLGPHFEDLKYREQGTTDHCIAVLLLIEKKIRNCNDQITLKFTERMRMTFASPRTPMRQSVVIRQTQGVNNIKKTLFSSHFVENSPVKIESMLHGVAQIQYQATNGLKPTQSLKVVSTSQIAEVNETDRAEEDYLRLEQKLRKRDRCSSQASMDKTGKE